jgi:ubiquinol-cytochrome c reductase cytochrome b subunit
MALVRKLALGLDRRFGTAKFAKKAAKHVFPNHWSFFLGEIAMYSFAILVASGIFLTLFFRPSMTDIIYHGSYTQLDGLHMSEAYASTLRISFDVRGGLLVRQIHHWAALVFVAAISVHAMRIFFTGAFRRPRELNWLVGTVMFVLAVVEGFTGYSLPDDLLSGTGLRIAEGIMQSIPVAGTYIVFFVFGGQYPGHAFIPRLYVVHVLLIPGLLAALIAAHLMAIWHQEHTQWPGPKQREDNTVGEPMFPVFIIKTQALFLFTAGVIALLATVAQINPIWLYGPYNTANVSSFSQPDWYIGFLEGTLRMMPGVVTNVGGHTFAWNVFLPAVLLPIMFILLMAAYPLIEEYATGDLRHHHILDRPRNAPTRTALGAAVLAMAFDIQLAGGDDVISYRFGVSLFALVWFLRAGFFVFPLVTFFITRYLCLALQHRDQRKMAAGTQIGVAAPADGRHYTEVAEPVSEDVRATIEARPATRLVMPMPRHIIPLPTPRRIHAQLRTRLNHFYVRYQRETLSGEDGQGRIEDPLISSHEPSLDGSSDGHRRARAGGPETRAGG